MEVYESKSPDDTYRIGREIGVKLQAGDVIAFEGDLGAGKTLFTQGIAEGLGITEAVNSPTFTILQIYESGRLPLYHFDVYRIGESDEMDEVGWDDFIYGSGVSVVEWSERISELLPEHHMRVTIDRDDVSDFEHRRIIIDRL